MRIPQTNCRVLLQSDKKLINLLNTKAMRTNNYQNYNQDEGNFTENNHDYQSDYEQYVGDENNLEEPMLLNDNSYLDSEFSNELDSNDSDQDFDESSLEEEDLEEGNPDDELEEEEDDWEDNNDDDWEDDEENGDEPDTFADDSLKVD